MSDYADDLAASVEDEWVKRQGLPVCSECDRHSELLSGDDDRFPHLCPDCHEERLVQAAYDDHIDYLIDREREGW